MRPAEPRVLGSHDVAGPVGGESPAPRPAAPRGSHVRCVYLVGGRVAAPPPIARFRASANIRGTEYRANSSTEF